MAWSDAITEVFKFLNNIIITPRKQIEKVINIYDTISSVLDETSVERIMIYKAHNGGGIIKPSGEFYVSALYEGYKSPFHSMKSRYQKVEVDEGYARMLLDLLVKDEVHLVTRDMKDGLLKGMFQNEGVTEARVYLLKQTKKAVNFCICQTSREWLQDQKEKSTLNIALGRIKQNLK